MNKTIAELEAAGTDATLRYWAVKWQRLMAIAAGRCRVLPDGQILTWSFAEE